jgi:hypothetical protein
MKESLHRMIVASFIPSLLLIGATPETATSATKIPGKEVVQSDHYETFSPGFYKHACKKFQRKPYCRYITIRDNWGGAYKARCVDINCKEWRIVETTVSS